MKNFLIRLVKLIVLIISVPTFLVLWTVFGILLLPVVGVLDIIWNGITYLFTGKASSTIGDQHYKFARNGGDWFYDWASAFMRNKE